MGLKAQVSDGDGLSERDFDVIARLLNQLAGIELKPEKRAMIAARISKRTRALGLHSLSEYCAYVSSPQGETEHGAFISVLTTNMTRFNREPKHFEHLREHILPNLRQKAERGERVRIWSAGCSSGEEAYDLAFAALGVCPKCPELDFKILATDIDRNILSIAQHGVYDAQAVTGLPENIRGAFFQPTGHSNGELSVAPAARKLISFGHLNLHSDWPFNGKFDVIMCRNVTIYFDAATQQRLWKRFAQALVPDGLLYIGHSENVSPELLGHLKPIAPSIYQSRGATGASGTATQQEGKT